MKKNFIYIIVSIIVICTLALIFFLFLASKKGDSSNNRTTEKTTTNVNENNEGNDNIAKDKRILIVYYSATSNTKRVAEKLASSLNADLFEVIPENIYTSEDLDWTNSNSRVSKEHNGESLRNVKLKETKVENWDLYDTVLIGYPIWWGIAAWPLDTFVISNDFSNKTVIPFCTSASSGLGESGILLAKKAGSGNWKEETRFSTSAADDDINSFINNIK